MTVLNIALGVAFVAAAGFFPALVLLDGLNLITGHGDQE